MKRIAAISLLVLALLAVVIISACTGNRTNEDTTIADTTVKENGDTSGIENDDTTQKEDDITSENNPSTSDSGEETDGEVTTEPAEKAEFVEIKLDLDGAERHFSNGNNTKAEQVDIEGYGKVVKISTTVDNASDPFIFFNIKRYMSDNKLGNVSANKYKFIVLKIKAENCSNSMFETYYCAGNISGATPGCSATTTFDNSDDEWQYIYYDLSDASNWSGRVNGFRFDYMQSATVKGEAVYISSVIFAVDFADACAAMGIKEPSTEVDTLAPDDQKKVDELLDNTIGSTSYDSYKPISAANEDAKLNLWFNHTYTRTPAKVVTPGEMKTYRMMLAKNEIEACQFILSSEDAYTGLLAEITDFKNGAGQTLRTELFSGHYFEVEGDNVIDPLIPYPNTEGGDDGRFAIEAGTSKTFVIKVHTLADSASGEYTATLTVKNSEGKEIKKATVFVYVWNFALPEETSCKTLMDLSWWNIYSFHKCYAGDDSLLYTKYYDYLLENRVCSYDLPYIDKDSGNPYTDSRINKYLDNPRVVAFQPTGWAKALTAEKIQNAYNYLSQKQEWLDKAYFYPVDEPGKQSDLDRINDAANEIKKYWPSYKLIAPMHVNYTLDSESKVDYFEYVKDSVTVWCPHTYFYNTYAEYSANRKLTMWITSRLEKNLGTFIERMATEQAGGDEAWWYVTRRPSDPEITLTMETDAVKYRILFWQQKLYNVDGFLYYLSNDWYDWKIEGSEETDLGWNNKHEVEPGSYDVYGNGVLVYCGAAVGIYGPVGSLRLECVRDGIEDFEYLTVLEDKYGKEMTDLIIKQLTTSLSKYKDDPEYFTILREKLGCLVEETLNK